MALSDILDRIAADARAEADAILEAAREEAERVIAEARAKAEAGAAHRVADARVEAHREAETVLATARLRARDDELSARLALARDVLERAEAALLALPDERYARLVAKGVAESALGGEYVLVSAADAPRLAKTLPAALEAAGARVTLAAEAADLPHGVLVSGDRTSVEVSPSAMVVARRDELAAAIDDILFGGDAEAPEGMPPGGEQGA